MKSVISQHTPDVGLRAEHRHKHGPSAASVDGDITSPAAQHLTVKVSSLLSPHTQFGPGPSPASPLTVLLRAQRPYWELMFEAIPYFKGRHLTHPILGEVGEERLGTWKDGVQEKSLSEPPTSRVFDPMSSLRRRRRRRRIFFLQLPTSTLRFRTLQTRFPEQWQEFLQF